MSLLKKLDTFLNLKWSQDKAEGMTLIKTTLTQMQTRISKSLGLFCSRITGMNLYLKKVMMASYIRNIYEYCLPLKKQYKLNGSLQKNFKAATL